MIPIILHLDMNSYFASVEQQDNLAWRGQPVGVCEHLGGIIIGASVEAKQWGIKTGTPVWEAKKLYPKIILAHTHPDRYRFYTRRFLKVVADYTDKVEKYSIDEVFLDITRVCNIRENVIARSASDEAISYKGLPRPSPSRLPLEATLSSVERSAALGARNDELVDPFAEAVNIAREIKKRMQKEVGDWLRCSVGIAANKVLAKIASDLKKPDGLVVVRPSLDCHSERASRRAEESLKHCIIDADCIRDPSAPQQFESKNCFVGRDDKRNYLEFTKQQLYQILKLTDIPGIGHRQEHNLNELGIKTLKDLRDFPKSHLITRFGYIGGHHLYNLGQLEGSWKAEVEDDQEIKSMGHMYTLPQEFRKPEFFLPTLYKLCEMVGRRLRRKELMGNVIHFYFHDKNYEGFGKSVKLGHFLQDGREIFLQAADIHADLARRSSRGSIQSIKLIGVTVAGLRPYQNQLSLFGDVERHRQLAAALDKINEKYGEFTICRAPILKAGKAFRDSVGFGRMKEL